MNLMIYTMAIWFTLTTAITTHPELLGDSRKNNTFITRLTQVLPDKTHVSESTPSKEAAIMTDTCYFVGVGDSVFLFPDAPVITLTPEVICSTAVITVHISGTLRNKGAKWVIYASGCGVGTPIGSTRGNSFVDASFSNSAYYIREETCLFGEVSLTIKGSCGSAAVGFNIADTDGDCTNDCVDGCPLDASKTSPGVCGCGMPELDSDSDGLMDCIDTDDDNDLIDDETDNCPFVYNKNQKDFDLDGLGNACDPILDLGGVVQNLTEIISGNINNPSLNQSLTKKLNRALSAYCNGNINQALNILNAFKDEVMDQPGKKISNAIANELLNLAQAMIHAIRNHTAQCPPADLKFSNQFISSVPSTSILYPNPAGQQTWLDLSHFQDGDVTIQLSDIKGLILRTWKSDQHNSGKMNLNLIGLAPGLYLVKTHNGTEMETFKLILK